MPTPVACPSRRFHEAVVLDAIRLPKLRKRRVGLSANQDLLLSRGPNTSRVAQANPGGQKLCCSAWSGDLSATTGWVAPPLPITLPELDCSTSRPSLALSGSSCGSFSRCEEVQRDLNVSTSQLATETLMGHAPFQVRFELWRETGFASTPLCCT